MDKQISYLIYYYRGEIKVKEGYMGNNFYPLDKKYPYHTGVPHKPMIVNSKGKIWAKQKDDIPRAKELLKDYITKQYVSTIQKNAELIRLQNFIGIMST